MGIAALWSLRSCHCLQPALPPSLVNSSHLTTTSALLFYSKQPLPFDSSQSGTALTLQPAFTLPPCLDFLPLSGKPGPLCLALLTHLQRCGCNLAALSPAPVGTGRSKACCGTSAACWRAGSNWKANRLPALGVQAVLRAG